MEERKKEWHKSQNREKDALKTANNKGIGSYCQ